MLGGLFGRARKTFASRHEAFAAFVLAQFLPQYRWEIPEADFSEWTQAAGSEFQNVSQMWFGYSASLAFMATATISKGM
jgi:hypothetical protein